jgi:hypothetical protein
VTGNVSSADTPPRKGRNLHEGSARDFLAGPSSISRALSRWFPEETGGERGIRTLDTGLSPYNALAGRPLRPLGHLSGGGEFYLVMAANRTAARRRPMVRLT